MRIVLISEVFVHGMGYLENVLPKYLARLGAEVDVIASSLPPNHHRDPAQQTYRGFSRGKTADIESLDGFRLHVLDHARSRGHIRLVGLRQKLSELRPDIVQTMTPIGWIAVDSALHKLRLGYRLFSGCHYHASVFPLAQTKTSSVAPERLRCLVERGLHGRVVSWLTEKYYAISPDCAEVAAQFFGVPARKTEICPLGVDTEIFHPPSIPFETAARAELRARLGFCDHEMVCVYSGRFTPDKNPLLLARTVAELNSAGHPVRGLFVGNGPQADDIAQCRGCVLRPFVPQVDLANLYRAADIAAWPTQESMSMLDAAACGLPVVASDTIGTPERLRGCGLAYRLNDVASLAATIRSLSDVHIRERLGLEGARRMRDEYSWSGIAERRFADYFAVLHPQTVSKSASVATIQSLPLDQQVPLAQPKRTSL